VNAIGDYVHAGGACTIRTPERRYGKTVRCWRYLAPSLENWAINSTREYLHIAKDGTGLVSASCHFGGRYDSLRYRERCYLLLVGESVITVLFIHGISNNPEHR
jgi:hypothetical protein